MIALHNDSEKKIHQERKLRVQRAVRAALPRLVLRPAAITERPIGMCIPQVLRILEMGAPQIDRDTLLTSIRLAMLADQWMYYILRDDEILPRQPSAAQAIEQARRWLAAGCPADLVARHCRLSPGDLK